MNVYQLEINETLKVTLNYENCQYSAYEALGDGFGLYMLDRGFKQNDIGDMADEIEAVIDGVDIARWHKVSRRYDDELNDALVKMFSRQNREYELITLNNYHAATLAIVYGLEPGDRVTGLQTSLDAWFKGDIYVMALEELQTYKNVANDSIFERWEITDSIGGVMLDDFKEVEQLAADYFELPMKTEAA